MTELSWLELEFLSSFARSEAVGLCVAIVFSDREAAFAPNSAHEQAVALGVQEREFFLLYVDIPRSEPQHFSQI